MFLLNSLNPRKANKLANGKHADCQGLWLVVRCHGLMMRCFRRKGRKVDGKSSSWLLHDHARFQGTSALVPCQAVENIS